LGRIVSGEVFAGAQQKLSAQKREPKKEKIDGNGWRARRSKMMGKTL